jgi:hypothetical protein
VLAFGQQLVHVAAPGDRPERGLGDLRDSEVVVLHVDDRLDRVDDPVIDDGVHPQRDVVAGDRLLRGHVHHGDLHVHLDQPGGERVDPDQAGLAYPGQGLPPAQYDALLVLADDPEAEHIGRPIPGTGRTGLPGPRTAPALLPAFGMPRPSFIITHPVSPPERSAA